MLRGVSVKDVATIRREASAALRAKGGWAASVGGWALWIALGLFVNQLCGLLAQPLVSGPQVGAQALVSLGLLLAALYYFRFTKVYGTTALAVAVVRGGPSVRHALSGFGRGWRAVAVHFWVAWRLLPTLLPALAVVCAGVVWGARAGRPALWFGLGTAVPLGVFALAAWYRYRFAYAVLADQPDWAGRAVVEAARRLAEARRRTLFALDAWFLCLSAAVYLPGGFFLAKGVRQIDWALAADALRAAAGGGDAGAMQPLSDALAPLSTGFMLLSVAGLVFSLWVQPFWTTALAVAYEDALDDADAAADGVPPAADGGGGPAHPTATRTNPCSATSPDASLS